MLWTHSLPRCASGMMQPCIECSLALRLLAAKRRSLADGNAIAQNNVGRENDLPA